MTKLPIVDFVTMEKVLLSLGFQAIRQKGSHIFYRHPDGRTTTLPKHPGRDLARPLIREILREIKLSPEEFQAQLKRIK
jgi:predicted RNA binding protein YcfA (HicA-like mRNA interferase family)